MQVLFIMMMIVMMMVIGRAKMLFPIFYMVTKIDYNR